MKNYTESAYVLNKYSENIVYRFSDGIVEVTMEDYLKQNPHKTEQDFKKLKAISDEIFYEEDRADSRHSKKKLSLEYMKESEMVQSNTLDEQFIHKQDGQAALRAAHILLKGSELTEIQKRRFIAHYFNNVPIREIARLEDRHMKSIQESLESANAKLKNIFKKF